ncbi:MAG: hypothetical protein FD120_1228 [Gammaproteobacteria bacterium]|nr:MAG: hypothetical protein FD120_1228 [Gammaproteobacteria bacterium]
MPVGVLVAPVISLMNDGEFDGIVFVVYPAVWPQQVTSCYSISGCRNIIP